MFSICWYLSCIKSELSPLVHKNCFFKNCLLFFCPADVNECKADINPCFNGGTCFDLYGTYECLCAKGWGGPQCNNGKSITNLPSYDLYCY